ncbi:hypothetical protein SAMN05444397_12011 [Flavobacterium aquidurense]|uniref:Por secretion system C-terminal sorting domain-containing protein n=1 Tax=Flavobacterium frigidimaris TaxID=262320 RepID=A0ABX4BJX4_FLAFR|nr:hypothetical protein [Flavobacterium frigidimaris]OXA75333.1 hypothetical protein B0A65_22175 [Flavobacterium frigidimaris]SDZ67449.1 hypothetical protein SAMN05444397_12011 [Flavobacterium aquidurense]
MKNYIYKTLLLFFISINVFGESPNWSVKENNFQYTMSFQGFINVDGKTLSSVNDKVGAFVNGECRGSANLLYVASEDKYIVYLTVFANVDNEIISFKIYDSANNTIRNVATTKAFENNKHYGNLFQSYSFASPSLRNNAEILDFGFKNLAVKTKTIAGSQITIFLDKGINVSALNALFELSPGAKLFVGTVQQTAGSNTIDFSTPIQFQVLSEDQSVLKQWTVTVKLGTAQFYKKDAVCYTGGVIKVLYGENNTAVTLTKSGLQLTSQNILNGETIFSNLEVGTYSINIGTINKEIIINQKQ